MKRVLILGASSSIGLALIDSLRGKYDIFAQGNNNYKEIPHDINSIRYAFTEQNIDGFIQQFSDQSFDAIVSLLGKTAYSFLSTTSLDEWNDVLFQNLSLPSILIAKLAKNLNQEASIVLTSSALADIGEVGMSHYSAAKSGLFGFTKSLAKELSYKSIRVNCLVPHLIETRNTEKLSAEKKSLFINSTQLKRIGKAEDVANAIEFLLSEKSNYITGQLIRLNGGSYF